MRKGQRVACVNDTFPPEASLVYRQLPKKGVIYTIRAVFLGRSKLVPAKPGDSDGEVGLLLEEIRNQDHEARFSLGGLEPGFSSERFAEIEEKAETRKIAVDEPVLVS